MSNEETVSAGTHFPATQSSDERNWAMFGHLSAFTAFFTGGVGAVVAPLVVWLVKRDTLSFAAGQALEALNFNITVAIAYALLVMMTIGTLGIGIVFTVPAGFALFVVWFVLTIVGAIKASEGVAYRYPFALRLVK